MGSVLGSFGAFRGKSGPFIPVTNSQKSQKRPKNAKNAFFQPTPQEIFWFFGKLLIFMYFWRNNRNPVSYIHLELNLLWGKCADNCHNRHNHGGVPFSSRRTFFPKRTQNWLLLGKFIRRIKTQIWRKKCHRHQLCQKIYDVRQTDHQTPSTPTKIPGTSNKTPSTPNETPGMPNKTSSLLK